MISPESWFDYERFFWTFQLTGLKIYLKKKTGMCESRKRIIGKTTIITGADSGKYLSLVL
jgi:hypothetical protein